MVKGKNKLARIHNDAIHHNYDTVHLLKVTPTQIYLVLPEKFNQKLLLAVEKI